MTPAPDADRVLLAHMRECIDRIGEYTGGELVVEQDLPPLAQALARMAVR